MRGLRMVVSVILIAAVMLGIVPVNPVYADANAMAAEMINFFKTANDIKDVNGLSTDEIHVYAVFVSNFYEPGKFTLNMLNDGPEADELAKKISEQFFNNTDSKNIETIKAIHKKVYSSILKTLDSGEGTLYGTNSTSNKTPLTGIELLKKMTNSKNDSIIYYGTERRVNLDLSSPAVQGAFKILSAYSVDFMLGENGLANMTALYTDGFGNIWGAYNEKNATTGMERPTENMNLKLVMPACLNPVAFTSFAASIIDNEFPRPTQATLKLPLNNAFAMGAFVDTKSMLGSFGDDVIPYYNVYEKLPTKDTTNILNIYGMSAPLPSVFNTNMALGTELDLHKKMPAYFKNGLNTVNPGGTYIVMANNLALAESKFNNHLPELENSNISIDTRLLVNYLYGTLRINCEIDPKTKESKNIADTLYYFGTSDNNIEWKTDFSDIGMLGASLFMNTNTSFFSESVVNNKLTTKLVELFNNYPNIDNRSLDKNNVVMLRTAANHLASAMGKQDSYVTVDVPKGLGQLVYMVANIDLNSYNYDAVKSASAAYLDKTTVINVPASVSALLSLTGAVVKEHGAIAPSLFTPATGSLGAITEVSQNSIVSIVNNKWWKTLTPTTGWVYSLTYNDSYMWDDLMNWKVKFDAANLILGINVFGKDFGYIDKLAANPNMQLFYTLHAYTLFSTHPLTLSGSKPADKVETTLNGAKVTYDINNFVANKENNWQGIFFGYLVDVLQMDKATKVDSQNQVHFDIYSFQSEFLPIANIDVTGGKLDLSSVNAESGVSTSEEKTLEEIQKDLVKKIYGIVSDGQNDYRDRWIKSTIDGWLLTIHRTMTGSWLANMSTVSSGSGSTYQGIVGYIQTPALEDLPFTSWMMKNYMQIYVLVLVLIVIFLVIMALLRMRTWQQGIAIFLFMSIALLLPNILIGNTINVTNKITDSIYSDRFDFWALTQHQQSLESLQSYTKGSKEAVIANTMEKAKELYTSDAGVRVKWMSPKKSGIFQSLFTNTNMSDSFATNLTIFKWLFSSFVYESEFVGNDPMATYLYRPYNSIVTAGSEYYALGEQSLLKKNQMSTNVSVGTSEDKINKTVTFEDNKGQAFDMTMDVNKTVGDIYDRAKNAERDKDYEKMFYAALIKNPEFFGEENFTKILYSTVKMEDIIAMRKIKPEGVIGLWGMGNPDVTSKIFTKAELSAVDNNAGVESNLDMTIDSAMSLEDANLATFLLNTESPYYYFYSILKYQYGNGRDFKGSLLDKDVFKVQNYRLLSSEKSVNGNIRDFLDLEGLFTYTIPYLTVCNDYVYDWTNLNGTRLEAFNFKEDGAEDNIGDSTASDAYFESRKLKENMNQVWNMYSPWVDQLNSLDIYNKKVKVGGKTVKVENTLNPSYYLIQGRPMIFSEADMYAKGYKVSDLSDIEIKMQRVLETTYKDMMYLVNYYDLDDDVLLGAAAMYATFNFNREFSQANLLGESVMIYPQSFEMKNFNHDAFMRLALLNSTGETVFASKDLYERVLEKTSIFTGLLLLVEDVLAIIVIPTLKLIVLLMLLFLGLLLCLSCVLNPPEKIVQTVMKSLMLPTMLFTAVTIVFAYVISLVVGEGLTAYVGSQNISLATNDPTITILLLILFGALYSIALVVLIKMMFDTFKSYGMASIIRGVGLAMEVANGAVKAVGKGVGRVGNTVGGAVMGGLTNGVSGAVEGGIHGAQGGKSMSILSSTIRERRGAREYAKAMGVKDIGKSIDDKASKPISGLQKEGYTEGGTKLGNRFEDFSYLKNKALDRVNEAKHGIKKTSQTISDVANGNYLEKSIQQMKNRDKSYEIKRMLKDSERAASYALKPTQAAINKMRTKGVNQNG